MMFSQQLKSYKFKLLASALILLHVCIGWSETLLFAHTTLLAITCHASIVIFSGCVQTMNIGTCDWYGGTVDGCDLGQMFNYQ